MSAIAKALRGDGPEREAYERLIATLEHLTLATTTAMELYGGRALNGVLETRTAAFDATGMLGGSYGVPCGSLWVANVSSHAVAIVAGQAQQAGTPPAVGIGMVVVPAGTARPVTVGNTTWTAFGTAGDTLCWTAFSGLQAFGVGR